MKNTVIIGVLLVLLGVAALTRVLPLDRGHHLDEPRNATVRDAASGMSDG